MVYKRVYLKTNIYYVSFMWITYDTKFNELLYHVYLITNIRNKKTDKSILSNTNIDALNI